MAALCALAAATAPAFAAGGATPGNPAGPATDWRAWRAIPRFVGLARLHQTEWRREKDGRSSREESWNDDAVVRFELVAERDIDGDSPHLVWRAESCEISGTTGMSVRARRPSESEDVTEGGSYQRTQPAGGSLVLSLDVATGHWEILTPGKLRGSYPVESRYEYHGHDSMGRPYDDVRVDDLNSDKVLSSQFSGTAAKEPEGIRGDVHQLTRPNDGVDRGVELTGTIELWPLYEDVEVEVTIDDYQAWRPRGTIGDPTLPGSNLPVRATLKPRGGASEMSVKARRFTFQLLDCSREPGVCLNWPLGAKDRDPDLRLAGTETPGTLAGEDQRFTVENPPDDAQAHPYAAARIDAFDFGARAELRVVCETDDGREIVGLLKSADRAQDLIEIPRKRLGDWVADAWREQHQVPDEPDDRDEEEVEGQPMNGDGYTLYEEYRGFVVNGKHVEGDPRRKDYFVLNLVGADARPGIDLFEELSGLRVHSKLRRSEMSQKERLMNGNHRDAPHRVDQHGVWVKTFSLKNLGGTGAYTPLKKAHVPGRPGITIGIGLLGRNDPDSLFSRSTVAEHSWDDTVNVPASQAAFAYDRAIAHELLHSVGVDHHGENNTRRIFHFLHANHPLNPERISRFVAKYPETDGSLAEARPGPTLTLTDEATGLELIAAARARAERTVEFYRSLRMDEIRARAVKMAASHAAWGKSADWWADVDLYDYARMQSVGLEIGRPHGTDSGADDCVMRYYFAEAYPVEGSETDFIYIPPGTNVAGLELCTSPRGTGVNAPSHKPQSRHGDAAAGLGDCRSQICPNDAVPMRKR